MKREFKKVLNLNKQKISSLRHDDLSNIKGGKKENAGKICPPQSLNCTLGDNCRN